MLALLSLTLSIYTLWLGHRYITPVARDIATLEEAPVIRAGERPGLVMQPVNAQAAPGINYDPYFWAAVNYFRRNNLVLYNTAWLGDPIIPIRPRPERLGDLDNNFYNLNPQFHVQLLQTETDAQHVFGKVAFVVLLRQDTPLTQNPFAEEPGDIEPGAFAANWHCEKGQEQRWMLCTPPNTALEPSEANKPRRR